MQKLYLLEEELENTFLKISDKIIKDKKNENKKEEKQKI